MDNFDYKILTTIADSQYHSGSTLAKIFNTSRASICKRITKLNLFLQEHTLSSWVIKRVTGKGYCLNKMFDYLSLDQIYHNLNANNINLEFFTIIDSTNSYLLNKDLPFDQYSVCLAEQQTHGRGRRTTDADQNSIWFSPFGQNIYCSIGWHYLGNQNALLGLSLVAGISIAEVLTEIGCVSVGLKWPNDVWLANKKVAGILTEIQGEPNGGCKLVIGMGINVFANYSSVQLQQLNRDITQPWTTVIPKEFIGNISRNQIIAKLLAKLITYYQRFINHGLADFLLKWQQYDILLHKLVDIDIAGKRKHGRVLGIDNQGALHIDIAGQKQVFHSGEVKIRTV